MCTSSEPFCQHSGLDSTVLSHKTQVRNTCMFFSSLSLCGRAGRDRVFLRAKAEVGLFSSGDRSWNLGPRTILVVSSKFQVSKCEGLLRTFFVRCLKF